MTLLQLLARCATAEATAAAGASGLLRTCSEPWARAHRTASSSAAAAAALSRTLTSSFASSTSQPPGPTQHQQQSCPEAAGHSARVPSPTPSPSTQQHTSNVFDFKTTHQPSSRSLPPDQPAGVLGCMPLLRSHAPPARPPHAHAWAAFRAHASAARKEPKRQPIHATVDISTILNRQRGPQGFQVIEFFPNAVAKEWCTPVDPETLGIHARDLSLFQTGNRLAPQRATITARDNVIFIKTEAVRAIVSADKVVVFKSFSERDNRNIIAPMLQAISTHDQFPFELCALEVLLHSTVNFFERRVGHLTWMLEIALHDLQGHSLQDPLSTVRNETLLQQLLPLYKALTALRNDAKETCAAMAAILASDQALAAICLSEQRNAAAASIPEDCGEPVNVQSVSTHARMQATRMLQSYEREMGSVESNLMEMEENLDTTRESWAMRLDSARNHLMLLNIVLSMVSISLSVTMVLPSILGANIQNGMEEMQPLFWTMAALSLGAGVLSYPYMNSLYKRHWKKGETELNKVNRLRIVLMQHLDDLDDIMAACQHMPSKVNRHQFGDFLKRHLPHMNISRDTLDFLFQQLDIDHDGFFEAMELLQRSSRELEAMGKIPTNDQVHHHMLRATALADVMPEGWHPVAQEGKWRRS